MALGTSLKHVQERKLWQAFQLLLGAKKHRLRHTVSPAGQSSQIYHSTTAPAGATPAAWMPSKVGDVLIQFSGNTPVAVWICTVTNTLTTYTWVGIAGTSIGTTVTQ